MILLKKTLIYRNTKMLKNYSAMNKVELEAELRRLQDDLEDMEETFQFHMRNTSDHISSRVVKKGEQEIEKLGTEINKIKQLLSME
jgi:hypothetical protein